MTTTRTDLVQVFVFRQVPETSLGPGFGGCELLQLRRAKDPMRGTWQPVMGHAEPGETATEAAIRELREETGLGPPSAGSLSMAVSAEPAAVQGDASGSGGWLGLWQLDGVHPFFVARTDTIYLSPAFAVEASDSWQPTLNGEHDAHRWVRSDNLNAFLWIGQRESVRELIDEIVLGREASEHLRIG